MMSPTEAAMLALHMISLVAGLMGHMFILNVCFFERIHGSHNLSPSDLILSSLASSDIGLQCVFFVSEIRPFFFVELLSLDNAWNGIRFALLCLRCCSLWFTTWFCLYCLVKIVIFTNPFLVRLVKIFLENVRWLLLITVLVSLATCLPLVLPWDFHPGAIGLANTSISTQSNASLKVSMMNVNTTKLSKKAFLAYGLNTLMNFALFLFSAVAILITLCRHMKRMEQSANGFRSPTLGAHSGAVKTIAALRILCSVSFLAMIITFYYDSSTSSPLIVTCILIFSYYPALTGMILILRVSRMKKTLVGILSLAACRSGEET
ncbi:taste receptor type 2 member 40-like [Ambystoma mexicanum]|uniref:taste receptor type 2 member 40-like n=1 Tax=Ambystoma mexicanum TaxID=8296 RepID=UPI0037E9A571